MIDEAFKRAFQGKPNPLQVGGDNNNHNRNVKSQMNLRDRPAIGGKKSSLKPANDLKKKQFRKNL